jgi:hypothetical protein
MNRPFLNLLAFTLLIELASCSRNNDNAQANCISRSAPLASTPIARQTLIDSAYSLFNRNGLSPANLQPVLLFNETLSVRNTNGVDYSGPVVQVISNQFVNGLPIFNTSASYIFDTAGKVIPYGTNGYEGPLPGADTAGHQALKTLRDDFLSTYNYSNPRSGPIGHLVNFYHDSCFTATLGYMDALLVPSSGITTSNQALIKVWQVKTSKGPSPWVFVVDSTGKAWTPPPCPYCARPGHYSSSRLLPG